MKNKEAYVFWNAGICYIVEYPSQKKICYSRQFRRATRKARNLGYDVKVYKGIYTSAPKDAIKISGGSYILPGVK